MRHPGNIFEVRWSFPRKPSELLFLRRLGRSAILGFAGSKKLQYEILSGEVTSLSVLLHASLYLLRQKESLDSKYVVVVVSALVALMSISDDKMESDVCLGEYQLVFLSHEALLNDFKWRDMLRAPVYQRKLVGFVVDEAHCVKNIMVST